MQPTLGERQDRSRQDFNAGYSVRFETNIPINYEDVYSNENFDATAAKLEIGNLQLQLIECLKLEK